MEDILQFAKEKSFLKFSDAVSKEMKQKLANNTDVLKHTDEFDRISKMKDLFKQIQTDFVKPIEQDPTPAPTGDKTPEE